MCRLHSQGTSEASIRISTTRLFGQAERSRPLGGRSPAPRLLGSKQEIAASALLVCSEVNTIWVSLLASCRMRRIEPLGYVRDLLCLLRRWPKHRALELAPAHWRKTIARSEVDQALASNILRQVALGQRT